MNDERSEPSMAGSAVVPIWPACRGTRTDGSACDAPAQYLDSETGLCGACGSNATGVAVDRAPGESGQVGTPGQNAPGSSIRTRGTTLADWEDEPAELLPDQLERLKEVKSALARAYLPAYVLLGNVGEAVKAAGCSSSVRRYWRATDPAYAELEAEVTEDVQVRWDTVIESLALGGLVERIYDKGGNLVGTKTRQDSAVIRMVAAGINPEKYGKETDSGGITLIINQVDE
jgi:hypothetical protein